MNAPISWNLIVNKNIVFRFIDVTLRGCAQVMFQNNALTGLIFFIAIFIGGYSAGNPAAAYGCLLGTAVSTLAGMTVSDKVSWSAGLYGYNGCLLGVALPVFISATPLLWGVIVIGSVISVIVTVCIADVLKTWKIAALTAPFVVITWITLLASFLFSGLHSSGLPVPALPVHEVMPVAESISNTFSINSLFYGISEVYLFSSVVVGVLFCIGLAVSSLWAALFSIIGSALSILTAIVMEANVSGIEAGLYSFSAVLTAVALGSTFNKPSWNVLGYTLLGVIFTVFVQAAMNVLLSPFGIPTLTMPFVLSSWLFLLPNKDIMPTHRQA